MDNSKIKSGATMWARQTIESEVFYYKPAAWFKIWFYIVQRINYKDSSLFKRGEGFLSYSEIQNNCKVSRGMVDHFIRWAKQATMIATQKTTRGMIVTVLNYNKFQKFDSYKNEAESDTESDIEATPKRHPSDTIHKKGKKESNISVQPEQKEIIDYFCKAWESANGSKYLFQGGKDAGLIKTMLAAYGKDKLKLLIDAFFKSNDSWIRDKGDTVGIMFANINKLVAKPSTKF